MLETLSYIRVVASLFRKMAASISDAMAMPGRKYHKRLKCFPVGNLKEQRLDIYTV